MALLINKTNYQAYKKVFEIIWNHKIKLFPPDFITDETCPIKQLARIEVQSLPNAIKGLKQALADLIIGIDDGGKNILKDIDKDLTDNQLPSLLQLRASVKNTIAKVLKAQRIKSEEEYYIVVELLSDTTAELNDTDRKILNNGIADFEAASKET